MAGVILRGFEVDIETFVGCLEVFPGLEVPFFCVSHHRSAIMTMTIRTYEFVLHGGVRTAS
jgi:voltage-gated potassium channel Kch